MEYIKQQLKNLKTQNGRINPDPAFVVSTRERLMNQIGNTVSTENKPTYNLDTLWQGLQVLVPGRFAYAVVRPLAIFILVGAMATGGWIASASATQNSLPGDLGYKVKMAVEKTQELVVAVTGSSQEKTQMQMEFAKRRAEEIKKVTQTPNKESQAKVAIAVAGLESSLKSAKENLQATAANAPEKMIDMVQEVGNQTAEINNNLKTAQQQDSTIVVAGVKQLVNDNLLSAVETVVQKKQEGALNEVSSNTVKQMVKEQIDKVMSGAAETASSSVLSTQFSVNTTTLSVGVSSTPIYNTTTSLEIKNNITSSSAAIVKDAKAAQNLINDNQLLEAIQTAKQVNDTAAQMEQKVSEAKQVIDSSVISNSSNLENKVISGKD